jgi:hypothetical protein
MSDAGAETNPSNNASIAPKARDLIPRNLFSLFMGIETAETDYALGWAAVKIVSGVRSKTLKTRNKRKSPKIMAVFRWFRFFRVLSVVLPSI